MRAYRKDIIRSIIKGRKRFLAIMMITALGVCMLGGIKAACEDLRYTADIFFDQQISKLNLLIQNNILQKN